MNSRKFLILIVPGLVLLLLFSSGNAKSLASVSAPAAPDTTLSGLPVEGGALAQALVNATPAFSVMMTPDPATLDEPGGTVTFTIVIVNEGVDEIFIVRVVDNIYGGLKTGDGDPPLDPGVTGNTCIDLTSILANDQDECSFNAPVTGPPGTYINEVTVTVEDADEVPATETDTAMVTIEDVPASIEVTLSAVPISVPEPGGNVTFTIDVENTSATDTVNIETFTGAPLLNELNNECNLPRTLMVDESLQCSVTVMVLGTPGQRNFTVTASGEDDDGVALEEASNTVQVTITNVPSSIVTTLSAVPTSVSQPGGSVAFTVRVDNTSAVDEVTITTLNGAAPLGNLHGKGNCTLPQTIAVGAFYQCSATVTVNGTAGQVKNFTVTASGTDDDGDAVSGGSNTVQITIAAPEMIHIFLPVAMRIHAAGEPNNTCAQAYGISINTDYYFLPDDKEDWYRFNLAGSGDLAVELTNFVPVMGQIVLYQGSTCSNLNFIANNGNFSSTKIINRAVGPGTYYVRVITDGPFSNTSYKLRIGFP